eukprot:TRINITY_DN25472_c0_g1_i1.p1 TRINITY_DN25472_c0_g1~~TRINITY_DN25472_c0_g1_i1.p1  ORF type:complete len:113 (+),score=2.97 TRINITY_DN25472_c0_g1_i1:402-740(+)
MGLLTVWELAHQRISRNCAWPMASEGDLKTGPAPAAFSLFRPTPGINYNFVLGAYGVCCGLLVLFYALEKLLKNAESIQGIWIIFTPFVPCLFWCLVMRTRAKSLEEKSKSE